MTRQTLKAHWKRLTVLSVATLIVASAGAVAYARSGTVPTTSNGDDCCQPGAPCCHPGAPCCDHHRHAQAH
jgi:hypothetical protein